MRNTIILIFFLSTFDFQGNAQIWNYPYEVYPYFSIGINEDMSMLKGVKSKTYLMYCQDTLTAYFEYDMDGRLIFKADEYGDTSLYGYTDNSNEWIYAFDANKDTLCAREIKFDESQAPNQIISNYKNGASKFEIKRINDSIFETYVDEIPKIQFVLDNRGRQQKISKFNNGWQTYITYDFSKDTVQYLYYYNESVYEKVIGVFKDSNLVEITTIDLKEPRNTIKRKHFYDKKGNLIEIKAARVTENGEFNFQRTDLFKYNSDNRMIKWIQYGPDAVFCKIEIIYKYYKN